MKERIRKYLRDTGAPVSADRILQDVLKIHSPNNLSAEKLLTSILGRDPGVERVESGLWTLASLRDAVGPVQESDFVTLVIESATRPATLDHVRGAAYFSSTGKSEGFSADRSQCSIDLMGLRGRMEDRVLVVWSASNLRLWNRLLRQFHVAQWSSHPLALSSLAAKVLGLETVDSPETLAGPLGMAAPGIERPADLARYFADCVSALLVSVPEAERASRPQLLRWLAQEPARIDFSRFAFGPELLESLPDSPGVYLMKNRSGDIIYVGKARNLRQRVRSYFRPRSVKDPKVRKIHQHLYELECVPLASEVEALLAELRLIRDFHPPVNLQTEVHERPARYGRDHRLILLVPDAGRTRAEVYFLRAGAFAGRQQARLGRAPSRRLLERVRSLYFTPSARTVRARKQWETEIVASWFAANGRTLNYIDVDEAGTLEGVTRLLESFLKDPAQLSQKIYYR